jgi:hypothetical protein
MHILRYKRKVAHKKGFSEDPEVIAERLAFAEDGATWTYKRLR